VARWARLLLGLRLRICSPQFYELPLALVVTALLAVAALWSQGWLIRIFWMAAAAAMVLVLARNVRDFKKDTIVRERSFYGALRVRNLQTG